MDDEYRHFDGYPRPRRIGLIVSLFLILLGVVWIDLYDVPNGLRRLACEISITPWHGIVRSPRFYWALPILLAEIAFWIRLLVWVWPRGDLEHTVPSDWILIALLILLGFGITLYAVSALQPAPWIGCP